MASPISSFALQWWYSPNTKVAISFSTDATITPSANSLLNKLDYTTGMSSSIEETYKLRNKITSHPVEAGVSVSDHIIVEPRQITIQGLITAMTVLPIDGPIGVSALNFYQLGNAVQFLFDAAKSQKLFDLVTGLYFGQSYFSLKNLAIESIDIPRNSQYGKTNIKFTINFREVVITNTNPTNTTTSSQASLDNTSGGVANG